MMGIDTMEMRVINVTPEMAKSFLAFNYKGNRNLKPSWVKDLAGRIQRGEWRLTHQGILFDKNGNLIDGQHRCHAVVEAGVPVDMVVVSGAEEDAYKVLDQGQKRNLSDLSGLDVRVSHIVSFLTRVKMGKTPTYMQQEPFVNGKVGTLSKELISFCGAARPKVSSVPIKAAAVALTLAGEDKQYVFGLYRSLVLRDYSNLPPISLQMLKQIDTGKVKSQNGTTAKDLFCRSYIMFQKDCANKKLILSETTASDIYKQVKLVLEDSIK
jgi:hypothetical protein